MKVAVLGAGVVGMTTAYELARDGHEVVVVDRHLEPASETSFAAAGFIAPGRSHAQASPEVLLDWLHRTRPIACPGIARGAARPDPLALGRRSGTEAPARARS